MAGSRTRSHDLEASEMIGQSKLRAEDVLDPRGASWGSQTKSKVLHQRWESSLRKKLDPQARVLGFHIYFMHP